MMMMRRRPQMVSVAMMISFFCLSDLSNAFAPPNLRMRHHNLLQHDDPAAAFTTSTALWMAKKRKASKNRKAEINRPVNKVAIQEPKGGDKEEEVESSKPDPNQPFEEASKMDNRPEVSTMIIDEETGTPILQQGKNVMDVVTRKAVQLHPSPEYRLAQLFPGVPMDVRAMHRQEWKSIEELIDKFEQAAMVEIDGKKTIPIHPSVTNTALDFVTANRDVMGRNMKLTLTRLYMRNLSKFNKDEAKRYLRLCKNFLTIENHTSAPFRQMMLDAEGRVGPNFGNLDVKSFCSGELYERCANYLVLKGMVAHWEKKVVDADYLEKNPQTPENYISTLSVGDPKRYLPNPPILYTLRECTQVCAMAQQMTKAFVEESTLFDDLPVELRFLEKALTIPGGTPVRQFTAEEFCPEENITPIALREGLRRLAAQLENMQTDPYADIYNTIVRLLDALSVGTDDVEFMKLYESYLSNLSPNGPGSFETYTFDHEELSRVRFLDGQYDSATSRGMGTSAADIEEDNIFGFNWNGPVVREEPKVKKEPYKVPKERACGRPHEVGWLKLLDDDEELKAEAAPFGEVKPGRIIMK